MNQKYVRTWKGVIPWSYNEHNKFLGLYIKLSAISKTTSDKVDIYVNNPHLYHNNFTGSGGIKKLKSHGVSRLWFLEFDYRKISIWKIRQIIHDHVVEFERYLQLTKKDQVSSKYAKFISDFNNTTTLPRNSKASSLLVWVELKIDHYNEAEATLEWMKPNKN